MTTVAALAIVMLLPFTGTIPREHRAVDTHMPAAFFQRVIEYVEIHRRVAAGVGHAALCGEPEELERQATALAVAIRRARPMAYEGEIFTPAVAAAFHARIAYAIRTAPLGVPVARPDEEELTIEVHDGLPWWMGDRPWPAIARALPDLAPELEYRVIGRHLVLVDVQAHLIVDVLRNALPAAHNR